MTAQTILPANSVVDSGFNVANSVNCGDESTRWSGSSKVTSTSQQIGSWNIWLKRTVFGAQGLFKVYEAANTGVEFGFDSSDQFFVKEFESGTDVFNLKTNAAFKDPSAWMNILLAIDTTQGTEANRIRLYINGVEPSLATSTRPSANTNLVRFFANSGDDSTQVHEMGNNYDGATGHYLLTQILHVDGTQLANTDVGEFDEDSGIWKPIDISETTLGNNGYYLSMEDSSNFGVATGKAMTAYGFAVTDSRTDTCTNNFATMNPLSSGMTLTEGNLNVANSGGKNAVSTFSVASGKWYVEMKATNAQTYNPIVGIATDNSTAVTNPASTDYPGNFAESHGYDRTGTITSSNATDQGSLTTSQSDNDIIGLAVDLDSGTKTAQWYVNGSSVGSAVTLVSDESYVFMTYSSGSQSGTGAWNFGNPTYANSSSATDGRGFGDFEYAPPSGFLSLCTKNLSEASS
jgi:hypothetical protein